MFLSTTALVYALAMPVLAPKPAVSKKVDSFEALVAHIRKVAENEEWRKEGWKDDALAEALSLLTEDIRKATKNEKWVPPVTLAETTAGDPTMPTGKLKTFAFLKGSSRQTGVLRQSILFVDGSVQLTTVEDSIIIARGAVQVSRCSRCVIVAGLHVHATSDQDLKAQAAQTGSVLLSGGSLSLTTAKGSVLHAGKELQMTAPSGVTVLNPPAKANYPKAQVTEIKDAKMAMAPVAKLNPLEGKLKVTEALMRVGTQGGVVVEIDGLERVIRPGKEVTGNDGKPLKGLEGWTLGFVATDGKLAVFTKGDEDAPFLLKGPVASGLATPAAANGALRLQLAPLLQKVPPAGP